METITRIAPTPSGYLHVGNALSFAVTWAIARQSSGKIILRIDDLDNARFRQEYLEDIFSSLEWLGIDYDLGPRDAQDFHQHFSQQKRISRYDIMLDRLVEKGMVYGCNCSRSVVLQDSKNGHYPKTCSKKNIPLESTDVAWRIRVPESTIITFQDLVLGEVHIPLGKEMPDFILKRKNKEPSYQIASLCDDLETGVNLIVRGKDLLVSTAVQCYLASLLDTSYFLHSRFVHHPLLTDAASIKLSKSQDAVSLSQWRRSQQGNEIAWGTIFESLGLLAQPIASPLLFLEKFNLDQLKQHR